MSTTMADGMVAGHAIRHLHSSLEQIMKGVMKFSGLSIYHGPAHCMQQHNHYAQK